jgi:hypothetical protein
MRFIPTLTILTTLVLGLSSARARAHLQSKLPSGYHLKNIIQVPADSQWPEVKDNANNIPLYNAELQCTITPYGFSLYGRHWDGVSEYWIRNVIAYTTDSENRRLSTGLHNWSFHDKKQPGAWEAQVSFFLYFVDFSFPSLLSFVPFSRR